MTDADLVDVAARGLASAGVFLMPAADLRRCVDTDEVAWARFASHWDDLAPDCYAAELGTRRLRRYGHLRFRPADGVARPMPHRVFVQPEHSNPLYIGRDRHFEPLTDAFAADPLLHRVLRLLGGLAVTLDDAAEWSAKVTQFRVIASVHDEARPTPEGIHRDGVTLVTSLLIGRRNAEGGESSVFDKNANCLLKTTLSEPGTLLLGDDRKTLHSVSPLRPRIPDEPAERDVLVITFAPLSANALPPCAGSATV